MKRKLENKLKTGDERLVVLRLFPLRHSTDIHGAELQVDAPSTNRTDKFTFFRASLVGPYPYKPHISFHPVVVSSGRSVGRSEMSRVRGPVAPPDILMAVVSTDPRQSTRMSVT